MSSERAWWEVEDRFFAQNLLARVGAAVLLKHFRLRHTSLSLCAAACSVGTVEEQKPNDDPDQDDGGYKADADDDGDA